MKNREETITRQLIKDVANIASNYIDVKSIKCSQRYDVKNDSESMTIVICSTENTFISTVYEWQNDYSVDALKKQIKEKLELITTKI